MGRRIRVLQTLGLTELVRCYLYRKFRSRCKWSKSITKVYSSLASALTRWINPEGKGEGSNDRRNREKPKETGGIGHLPFAFSVVFYSTILAEYFFLKIGFEIFRQGAHVATRKGFLADEPHFLISSEKLCFISILNIIWTFLFRVRCLYFYLSEDNFCSIRVFRFIIQQQSQSQANGDKFFNMTLPTRKDASKMRFGWVAFASNSKCWNSTKVKLSTRNVRHPAKWIACFLVFLPLTWRVAGKDFGRWPIWVNTNPVFFIKHCGEESFKLVFFGKQKKKKLKCCSRRIVEARIRFRHVPVGPSGRRQNAASETDKRQIAVHLEKDFRPMGRSYKCSLTKEGSKNRNHSSNNK